MRITLNISSMRKSLLIVSICFLLFQHALAQNPIPGYLANPGFQNEAIKSVFFFSGNWRNGVQFYDHNPTDNRGLYTLHPADARHLGWSENQSNRDFAVQSMIHAGTNVINMSYWGLPGTDNWAHWSPMQSSTASHDELFNTAIDKNILIAPYIESYAATDNHEGYFFADDFPGTPSNPAPLLISKIEDLVTRYLVNPANSQWPSKWARVYDQNGSERYLISIIHVSSNQEAVTDQAFAAGFDQVAEKVFQNTGIRIGFALDVLPPDSYAPGIFKATPLSTGSWLKQQVSVIAIQCFLPEIWTGMNNEYDLIAWKNSYHLSWINTGIPFIHDLTPGYDAHIVFPSSPVYGNTQSWLDLQSQAIDNFGSSSLTYNSWNGFTEGMAGMPTLEHGNTSYLWLCNHFGGSCSSSSISDRDFRESLRVLPNPVDYQIHARLNSPGEYFISYKIINCSGIIQKSSRLNSSSLPGSSIIIPTEDLIPGMYFLIVSTNFSTYVKKVLKPDRNLH